MHYSLANSLTQRVIPGVLRARGETALADYFAGQPAVTDTDELRALHAAAERVSDTSVAAYLLFGSVVGDPEQAQACALNAQAADSIVTVTKALAEGWEREALFRLATLPYEGTTADALRVEARALLDATFA